MTELEETEQLLTALRKVKTELKRRDRLSEKSARTDYRTATQKQLQKINVDLNWQSMELDKARTAFARAFHGSSVDVGAGPKVYRPSGYHTYTF